MVIDDDAREAYLDGLVEDYARRMGKEFGTRLQQNPEVAARVLAHYFGAQLGKLFDELRAFARDLPDSGEDIAEAEF